MTATTARLTSLAPVVTPRKSAVYAGRALTGLATLFLGWDASMKLVLHPMVVEASAKMGMTTSLVQTIGAILASCLVLSLIPRTAVLGAVLLTGYLGGAVYVHLQLGNPLLTHVLFPVYVGAVVWGGLVLRDARVRRLIVGSSV